MKKLVAIIGIFLVIIGVVLLNFSYALEETYALEFEVLKANENFDLYILLPKDYIEFAIKEDGLDLEYKGANTLKDNDIPSIRVNKDNISDEIYEENGIEYTQILLEPNEDGKYEFDILSSYPYMDMKFRIKNINKDYIVHIDNFKVDGGVCKVQYNYKEDTVKQPETGILPFVTKLLLIVLIVIIVVGIIAYIKKRR